MTRTANDVYMQLFKRFRAERTPDPALEARELTACVCKADRRRTANWAHVYLDDHTVAAAEALADRYLAGEPLAYLLGEWDFYGLPFKVTKDVLIPRSDTEKLCELAIERAQQVYEPRVLDLCTGSGCIGIALLSKVDDARVTAVDLSVAALEVAQENALLNTVATRFFPVRCNVLAAPPTELGKFHIIVCNPPYITSDEMQTLDHSVKDFEPNDALYGGLDGLDFYRAVCRKWLDLLLPCGELLFECGWQQSTTVADIMEESGLTNIHIEEDLSGVPRIVIGEKDII